VSILQSVGAAPAARAYSYWLTLYRRTWRGTVVTSVVNPVMYLAAMGVGLGTLVHAGHGTNGLTYLQFVAPGLLAATAMQTGAFESTYSVLGSFKWIRNYHAMAATPLMPADIMVGHACWIATRVTTTSAVYLGALAAFGALRTPFALLALPAGVLVGMSFSLPVMAYSATLERDNGFAALQRFVIVPMFLFSGTFFNVTQLPTWIRPVAYVTPLWHGVRLVRDATTGQLEPGAAWLIPVHVAYLLALCIAGLAFSLRFFRHRLGE
jgi:lipooligosaccharide transport system permease protein